jgi:hypothetical protein
MPQKGFRHSKETKLKISMRLKGQSPWNKGKKEIYSKETREKMSKAKKGKPLSEEHRKKISEAHKGKKRPPFTEEWKRKLSESHKGKKHSYKGVPFTPERKKKISEIMKKIWQNTKLRKKIAERMKGEKNPMKRFEVAKKISESKKGEKSNLWKGGKMKEYPILVQLRKNEQTKLWRKAVFQRDNFTCQKCGQSGGRLVAHHIFNFADFPEYRFLVENGITLCRKCHDEFHKIYGKHHNTKEQLEEFLGRNFIYAIQSCQARESMVDN